MDRDLLNLQRWIIATRRAWQQEPQGPRKNLLRAALIELLRRLP